MDNRKKDISGYLPILDGLRALSVIFIFIFHDWQQSWLTFVIPLSPTKNLFSLEIMQRYGYIAIDSFFVLSGFCLFYPVARAMFGECEKQSWKEFYKKRARRILPAYYVLLFLVLIFPPLSTSTYTHDLPTILKQFGLHATFLHIFFPDTAGSIIGVAWMLGTEVWIYIVFPFIAEAFKKKPVLTCIGMVAISQVTRLYIAGFTDTATNVMSNPLGYLDVFGFGMVAAYFVVRTRNNVKNIGAAKIPLTVMSILSLVIVYMYTKFMGSLQIKDLNDVPTYFRLCTRWFADFFIAAFLYTGAFSAKIWSEKIMGNRFFVFMSGISYSFFLWHQNIHILLRKLNIPYTKAARPVDDRAAMEGYVVLSVVLSITIAVLSTYLIEKPIAKYGVKGYIKHIAGVFKKNDRV